MKLTKLNSRNRIRTGPIPLRDLLRGQDGEYAVLLKAVQSGKTIQVQDYGSLEGWSDIKESLVLEKASHYRIKPDAPLKLDLGSGPNGKPGFIHVDQTAFPGVDVVMDLAKPVYKPIPKGFEWMAECFERKVTGYEPWPWDDNSVEEAHSSHCLEHFDAMERVHFLNELYRVLKPGAKCTLITPHWASCRAYGDPTHKWPPLSEFAFFYWKKDWRMVNAPHTDITNLAGGFDCNFDVTWGYSLEPGVAARNQEYQQHAMTYWTEARQDIIATLTKC